MKLFTALFFISVACITVYALPTDPYPFSSEKETKRFVTLTQEIRCVVCQNQNISSSNAPLATDLREKVYRMIVEKKSDAEIKTYLVKRYGEFILFEPPFNSLTLLLWLFPFIGLLAALFFVYRFAIARHTPSLL